MQGIVPFDFRQMRTTICRQANQMVARPAWEIMFKSANSGQIFTQLSRWYRSNTGFSRMPRSDLFIFPHCPVNTAYVRWIQLSINLGQWSRMQIAIWAKKFISRLKIDEFQRKFHEYIAENVDFPACITSKRSLPVQLWDSAVNKASAHGFYFCADTQKNLDRRSIIDGK